MGVVVMLMIAVGMVVMTMPVRVVVMMLVCMREVNVKLDASDGRLLLARDVEVPAIELELVQLAFELARIHTEIQQRGDEHVAGNAAEQVEVKSLHASARSALIWLAA